jgi:malonate transporter
MSIIEIILVVFGLIALGYISVKLNWLRQEHTSGLNHFAYYFALPAVIFINLSAISFSVIADYKLIFLNLSVLVGTFILFYLILSISRAAPQTRNALLICTILGNTGYLGLPIAKLAFGESVMGTASLITAIHTFTGILLSLIVLEKGKKHFLSGILANPIIWSGILGVAFSFFAIKLPETISYMLASVAATSVAVPAFAVGMFLAGFKIRKHVVMLGVLSTTLKLLALPLIAFFLAKLFGVTGIKASITILMAAMPTAIATFVLTEKNPFEKDVSAATIIISTLISIITLSGVLYLVGV